MIDRGETSDFVGASPGNDLHHHHHGVHEHDTTDARRSRVQRLRHLFVAHSHAPADKVDAALASSDLGIRAVRKSLAVLLATCAIQAVVVVTSGSVALLSDTVHNLSDALTALPLWFAFALGRRRPSRRYTYGYGRAEDLAGVFVVVVVALSVVVAAYESIDRLFNPRPVRDLGLLVAAGIIGFVGNELVAVYRIRVGRRIGSAALVTDGLHARTDGLTSLAVVLGALGVAAGWQQADAVIGLAIAGIILVMLKGATRDVIHRLMDAVDPALVDEIERRAGEISGVAGVDQPRLRWVGHSLHAELRIVVGASRTVADGHRIAEEIHHELLHRTPRLASVIVHVDPDEHEIADAHFQTTHHYPVSSL